MLVDALAHLNDPRIPDVSALLIRARDAGVSDIVLGGTDPVNDSESMPQAPDGLHIWRAFGIHPMVVGQRPLSEQLRSLRERLTGPNVVAIGECGLDRRPGMPPLVAQKDAFKAQLKLACELDLPVIFHQVRAMGAFVDLVQEPEFHGLRGMVHGYSGSAESARQLVKRGFYISFGTNLLSVRQKHARASLLEIPDRQLLVESDAPNHPPPDSPRPICEPVDLHLILQQMSTLRQTPLAQLRALTAGNAKNLFRLPTQNGCGHAP